MRRTAHHTTARRAAGLAAAAGLVWVIAPGRLQAQSEPDVQHHESSEEASRAEPARAPDLPSAPGALPRASGEDMPALFPEESDGWDTAGAVVLGVLVTALLATGGVAAGLVIGGELASCSDHDWFCPGSATLTGGYAGGLIGITVGIVITTALIHRAEGDE